MFAVWAGVAQNIPISWKERLGDSARPTPWNVDEDPSATPLVFAGGPTATSNPEPFADFFDYFALGDGEDLLPEVRAACGCDCSTPWLGTECVGQLLGSVDAPKTNKFDRNSCNDLRLGTLKLLPWSNVDKCRVGRCKWPARVLMVPIL